MTINYDEFYENIERKTKLHSPIRWWVYAIEDGKRAVLGPCQTQDEAERLGFEKLRTNYEVFPLPTVDRAKATAILKARLVKRGFGLSDSLRRFKHDV